VRWRVPVRELARRTGLSPTQVSRVFRGERLPSIRTALKLADAYDVSLDVLVRQWLGLTAEGPDDGD
jgi:transcriptional regulator with XRE-family HTH domain